MSDDLDARLEQIQERNEDILAHFVHTWHGRLSDDTLYQHVLNVRHFTGGYLNYRASIDEPRLVEQITAGDVYDFITDWLPRKSWVDSERRIKSYLSTFKKYVQFMAEQGYMPADRAADILRSLKEDREDMIRAAVTYYDAPDESQSSEAFSAHLKELEAQWAAIFDKEA